MKPRRCFYCNKPLRTSDKVHWVPEFIIVEDKKKLKQGVVKVSITSKALRPWCDHCYKKSFSGDKGQRFLKLLMEMWEEVSKGEKG